MEIVSRTSPTEYLALIGKSVDAIYQDAGYWHLFVALRCQDGQTAVFSTEEVGVAKYFEVFPIKVATEATEQRSWRALGEPKRIEAVIPLLREEWLEPMAPHPEHVGSAPHYAHHAGRGPASAQAVQHIVVQAGFELRCQNASSIVVFASNTAPFNVEIAYEEAAIKDALSAFSAAEA